MSQKPEKIDTNINDFFKRIVRSKNGKKFSDFLKFIKRMPEQSPFNDSLVFVQNSNCSYYATSKQWENRFKRRVKDNAQLLIILVPFGPVAFAYDIEDTEGEPLDKKSLFWWQEKNGYFRESIYKNTIDHCKKFGINFYIGDREKYLFQNGLRSFGIATSLINNSQNEIILHPKYKTKKNIKEAYGVLCHELAHQLLGHLGEIKVSLPIQANLFSSRAKVRYKKIAPDRKNIVKENVKELEAELTAWIVFSYWGMEKNSEIYMAEWLLEEDDAKEINYSLVFKVAGKIKQMGLDEIR